MMFAKQFFLLILSLYVTILSVHGQGQWHGCDHISLQLKGRIKSLHIQKLKVEISAEGKIQPGDPFPNFGGTMVNNGDMQDSILFNHRGNIESSYYYPYNDSSHISFTQYYYNETGNIIERRVHHKTRLHESFRKEKFSYDSLGILLRMDEYFGKSDTASAWYIYNFEGKGNQRKASLHLFGIGFNKTYVYQYDSLYRVTALTLFDKNNQQISSSRIPPNERFHIIESPKTLRNHGYYRDYTFDGQGNWTNMVQYENFRATAIIKRKISYYP